MTETELTTVLFRLADSGVTGVKIVYDGAGDSGSIESVVYTAEPCETPEDIDDKVDGYDYESKLSDIDIDAADALSNFADSVLLNEIEDWWNNEGGYGTLCIMVPSGKYIINNHIRITDTEDYFHDGDLLSKVED
jgi:hypothetical protein